MTDYPFNLKTIIADAKTPVIEMGIKPVALDDCHNCGGIGQVFIFLATRGPYRNVFVGLAKDEIIKSMDDEIYGWVWYAGKTFAGECPDCHGMGRSTEQVLHQYNTRQPAKQLEEHFKVGISAD